MRLVQTRVSKEARERVLETLDEENIEHVVADEGGDSDAVIVYFPLPDGAVEKVLDRLQSEGLHEDAFTVITDIQSATTPSLDELESQYTQGPDDEVGLSHATLRTNAREVTPSRPMFVTFAALSAIVAAAGLILNSAIVIVGAMVISPFAGSALSASVGVVIGDYESVLDSLRSQLVGLVVVVTSATAAAFVFRYGRLVPTRLAIENISQVSAFSIPIVLTFVIAVFAGAAGALALATDLSVSLAGVAVAAAIVPAGSAVGLGVVWVKPMLALGAVVLLLMNILLINVSAFVALTLFGYRSPASARLRDYLRFDVGTVAYAALGAVVLVLLVGSLVSTYQYFVLVETVNQNVDEVLTEEPYASLELVDVQTDYEARLVAPAEPDTVTVVVGRAAGTEYPDLSAALQGAIAEDATRPVTVRVRFQSYQETTPGSGAVESASERTGVAAAVGALGSPRTTTLPSAAPTAR
ncbi:TIGR00341 family protein [Halobium salinum]|uniref:TIGR00341 family protein n=1 Tax=Halobium salinum TaxID=1364940 RepID=A0ABD5PFL3_9EURY|nr:TIGR00341 family protein [Halobium salinum]